MPRCWLIVFFSLLPALGFAESPAVWHTAIRTAAAWNPAIDIQTDAVLLENIDASFPERVRFWDMQGYNVQAVIPAEGGEEVRALLTQAVKFGLKGILIEPGAAPQLAETWIGLTKDAVHPLEDNTLASIAVIPMPPRPAVGTHNWSEFGRAWRCGVASALTLDVQRLELLRAPETIFAVNDGAEAWDERIDPAVAEGMIAVSNAVAQALASRQAAIAASEHEHYRRGNFAVLTNSGEVETTIVLRRPAIDLFSPDLAITNTIRVPAHDAAFVVDFDPSLRQPVIAATARTGTPKASARRLTGQMRGPSGTEGRMRVALPKPPGYTVFHWNPTEVLEKTIEWDPATGTALFRYRNMGARQFMEINW